MGIPTWAVWESPTSFRSKYKRESSVSHFSNSFLFVCLGVSPLPITGWQSKAFLAKWNEVFLRQPESIRLTQHHSITPWNGYQYPSATEFSCWAWLKALRMPGSTQPRPIKEPGWEVKEAHVHDLPGDHRGGWKLTSDHARKELLLTIIREWICQFLPSVDVCLFSTFHVSGRWHERS